VGREALPQFGVSIVIYREVCGAEVGLKVSEGRTSGHWHDHAARLGRWLGRWLQDLAVLRPQVSRG
jgi:hypothetical protein